MRSDIHKKTETPMDTEMSASHSPAVNGLRNFQKLLDTLRAGTMSARPTFSKDTVHAVTVDL